MKDEIASSTPHHFLDSGVIGFSGFSNIEITRRHVSENGHVTLIQNDTYLIALYYNPAVTFFHEAQDALGIYVANDTVRFAIADGVSVVRGILENDSGLLAHQLVIESCKQANKNLNETVRSVYSAFSKAGNLGDSTFTYGEIDQHNAIRLFFIGDQSDMGHIYLASGSTVNTIAIRSKGNVGRQYQAAEITETLTNQSALIATTDGITILKSDITPFIRKIRADFSLSAVTQALTALIPENQDDQSLIAIIRK